MSLCVKTGMSSEYAVAKKFAAADVVVLTGTQTVADLQQNVPQDCAAIISFGLCGGLAPEYDAGNAQCVVAQAFIYDRVVTPDAVYPCDAAWRQRLFAATKYFERGCWSSGAFNTANDEAQRAALFAQSGCWIIDDETRAVAEFAAARAIAFIGLRVVSDGAEDNLPPAVINALNPDGTDNLQAVIASVIADPAQLPALVKTAQEFELSLAELRTAAQSVGPMFQWTGG